MVCVTTQISLLISYWDLGIVQNLQQSFTQRKMDSHHSSTGTHEHFHHRQFNSCFDLKQVIQDNFLLSHTEAL